PGVGRYPHGSENSRSKCGAIVAAVGAVCDRAVIDRAYSQASAHFIGGAMVKRVGLVLCVVLSAAVFVRGQGRGAPQPPRPDNPQSLAHIDAAKKIAADDPFLANPFTFYCVAGKARAQNNAAPALEPVKLFDNLYGFGNSETAVYGLTTS